MCSTRAVEGIKHMMFVEADYLKWLCDVVLFELRMGLSGVFVRGGRTAGSRARAAWHDSAGLGPGLGVTLSRLAGLFGMLITSRGPGTLHVLSIPYKLLGDKRVPSTELRDSQSQHVASCFPKMCGLMDKFMLRFLRVAIQTISMCGQSSHSSKTTNWIQGRNTSRM